MLSSSTIILRLLGYTGRELEYRAVVAALLVSPTYALLVFWFTFGGISLGTAMIYFAMVPLILGLLVASVARSRGYEFANRLGLYGIYSLLPYAIYDWVRVPTNYFLGLPFWDHWFDWGISVMGLPVSQTFSYTALTMGLLTHVLRGWSFGMVYYTLVQKPTLRSAFLWVWVLTIFYWAFFPVYVLVDSRPPFIWWFVAWLSHMAMAVGLWLAPKIHQRFY